MSELTLLCWHSERAGFQVLENALEGLRNQHVIIGQVFYLVQTSKKSEVPYKINDIPIKVYPLDIGDPTRHQMIYEKIRDDILPIIKKIPELHINISPGTPAMHSVWLILHAGGVFPEGTQLWSSQYDPGTKRSRIDKVSFQINTYLSEINRLKHLDPGVAIYELEARSKLRQKAFERLERYARVEGAPLLIIGDRGTGKTRIVEKIVAKLKQREKVITLPCGGLDSTLAESLLFGHSKGAFTGAIASKEGLIKEADKSILFLDEVQDLPKAIQRKLVRVFQDHSRRFRRLGETEEESSNFELVCASNKKFHILRKELDADFFDRLSHLVVEIPPLRDCREDLRDDWQRVWSELRRSESFPKEAPESDELVKIFQNHPLSGNLRDLQRLASLIMAWWPRHQCETAISKALKEWQRWENTDIGPEEKQFGQGSRKDRIRWFQAELATWAKKKYGTWSAAAKELECDEKTLREDIKGCKLSNQNKSVRIAE
jgi:DNA-binding NtrC family response regulator